MSIPVTVQSKALVCGRSPAGIVGSNLAGRGGGILIVVCCQVEISAKCLSLVQRIPTECVVSEYDRESSKMGRPWPTGGCYAMEEKNATHD